MDISEWVKLYVANIQGLVKKLNILSAPSFVVYREGPEVERFVGDRVNYQELSEYLERV